MKALQVSARAFLRSFGYALKGIAYIFHTQQNMRVHGLIAACVALAGLWLSISSVEWAVIAVTMGVVFAAEALNTVVEDLVDLVSPDRHPLAEAAKDAAAGGVLIIAIFAVMVGVFIFAPRLWLMLNR